MPASAMRQATRVETVFENGNKITTTTVVTEEAGKPTKKEVTVVTEGAKGTSRSTHVTHGSENIEELMQAVSLKEGQQQKENTQPPKKKRVGSGDKFEIKEIHQTILDNHNTLRKEHGVAPLELDKELCAYAQEWADQLAASGQFAHRRNNAYGENLMMISAPEKCVKMWYDGEEAKYNFANPTYTPGSGHFTQVIWKGSQRLGVAVAKRNDGVSVVVCNYEPAGNVMGHFKENVFPKN